MKNIFGKLMIALMLCGALCMSSCGFDMDKMIGDWTVQTVNGKSAADFAAASGVGEWCTAKNYKITDSKITISAMDEQGKIASQDYEIKKKSDGFDASALGITLGFTYNDENDTVKYSIMLNEVQYTYILKKGTTDIEGLLNAAAGQSTEEPAEAPSADPSSAETVSEDEPA